VFGAAFSEFQGVFRQPDVNLSVHYAAPSLRTEHQCFRQFTVELEAKGSAKGAHSFPINVP